MYLSKDTGMAGEPAKASTAKHLAPAIAALAALVALATSWAVWRASFPMEINFNEPWNAWLADLAMQRDRLYPPSDALILNNYPPLSRIFMHWIAKSPVFTNALYAGRALSLVSLFASRGAVFCVSRELGARAIPATLGALWFIALVIQFFPEVVGTCDPNLLGLAAMYWAFYLFLRSTTSAAMLASIFAMAMAGLIKQNLLAAPLTALTYLFLTRPKLAVYATAFGGLVCTLSVIVCWEIYGDRFLAQMMAPREMLWLKPFHSLGQLQWVLPVWPFWFYWLKTAENIRAKQITVILTLTSAVTWLFWKMGSGVASNSQLELIFASAVAAALTVGGLAGIRMRLGKFSIDLAALCAFVIVVRALTSWQDLNYAEWFDRNYREGVLARSQVTEAEVARIAALPRQVSCSVRTVCYLAGKPYIFDPFSVAQQLATHRATKTAIEERSRAIRFEPIAAEAQW